jgi:hypothetical protein
MFAVREVDEHFKGNARLPNDRFSTLFAEATRYLISVSLSKD